ncbi:hypothetical protein GBA52_017746 [Prunus armeniaca]|nr:hypothetical protein GBA52_017746 [Prunus armeniaca]
MPTRHNQEDLCWQSDDSSVTKASDLYKPLTVAMLNEQTLHNDMSHAPARMSVFDMGSIIL